ncbi:MAG TPA: peptidoglycan DD-metalloendopeptidase family protein [Gemmatimonadaceae bacterium]
MRTGQVLRLRLRMTATALFLALAAPAALHAQDRVRQQQEELDRLRRERAELERQAQTLQGSVHALSEEVGNIDRQAEATAKVVRALDAQLASIVEEVDSANARVRAAEAELDGKKGALQRRLTEIYKRGPMFDVAAMLSAQSFGALIARYKYLHQLARHDRAMVRRVEKLRDEIAVQQGVLVRLQRTLEDNRADQAREQLRLAELERQRRAALTDTKKQAARTAARIRELRNDEQRMSRLIADAMAAADRRRATTGSRAPASPSSIRTSDVGRLDWPVEGAFLYDFGKAQKANNTMVRWNGLGISAAAGTPVRAVAGGRVIEAARFGTYGLTVIVEHGGGDYSIYGSLGRIDVAKGSTVAKGQALGTVGVSDPDLGPHLHFEIRHGGPAVDPKQWLRDRR